MGYNLTQINPAYELVSDVIVGTATTSVDFNGLSIGKEDDYILVSDISNTTSNAGIYLYANANYTTTNYYSQELSANNTSVLAGRYNIPYVSGVQTNQKTLSITKIKLTNNGNFVYQSGSNYHYTGSIVLINTNGTSTFTMTSITSLRVNVSVSNAIGIGSRFQLYKRVAPIVYDYTVSSAMTSLDITGLNITKDSEYMLVSTLVGGLDNELKLYANGNTTDTNYYSQYLFALSTSVSSARQNTASFTYNNSGAFSIATIKLTNNGYVVVQSNNMRALTSPYNLALINYYTTSTFTTTSLTQLTITHPVANGIGVGSRFQLIKLK